MGLMDLFKKKEFNDDQIVSIVDGDMISPSEINDPMFSQEMMGKTIGFKLDGDTIVAPINGTLSVMYPTGHAFGIEQENGLSVLVHIGIDTVELNGKYFKTFHKQGDSVKAGDVVVKINKAEIEKAGYDTTTMLIITKQVGNQEFISNRHINKGELITK